MYTIETKEKEYKGFTIRVNIHRDEFNGQPWKEHDCHGEVVERRSREDKAPGERILNDARHGVYCYDFAGTIKRAKAEGWGIKHSDKCALASRLNKTVPQLTAGEIITEAVRLDFEHLRGWLNDEWQWVGYTAEIWQDGEKTQDADASCWGFESTGMDYVYESAFGEVECEVDKMAASQANVEQFALELCAFA